MIVHLERSYIYIHNSFSLSRLGNMSVKWTKQPEMIVYYSSIYKVAMYNAAIVGLQ